MVIRATILICCSLLFAACGGGGGSSSDSGSSVTTECANPVATSAYMMTFHACDTATASCSDPRNHTIYLAASNDGVGWSLIESFVPRAGSVPDIAMHDGSLYLFHTGGNENWVRYNACLEPTATGMTTIAGESGGFVDPSLIEVEGLLTLFYLPGVFGADPAGCSSYPCTKEIHSATMNGADPSAMTQAPGARVGETITNGVLSDPDIVRRADGTYLLYISMGQSTKVYTSFSPTGSFTAGSMVSDGAGGVPTALANDDGSVWLYVTTNSQGHETIRRGVSPDGTTPVTDFTTVADTGISSVFSATTSLSSPSVIRWPIGWSR